MGNYKQLKQAVSDVIKTNGNQEITGAIMQNTLLTIISTVGENATFAGIATPETNPGTPDQNLFYIASKNGLYVNFGGVRLTDEIVIFTNKNGTWQKNNTNIANENKTSYSSVNKDVETGGSGAFYLTDGYLFKDWGNKVLLIIEEWNISNTDIRFSYYINGDEAQKILKQNITGAGIYVLTFEDVPYKIKPYVLATDVAEDGFVSLKMYDRISTLVYIDSSKLPQIGPDIETLKFEVDKINKKIGADEIVKEVKGNELPDNSYYALNVQIGSTLSENPLEISGYSGRVESVLKGQIIELYSVNNTNITPWALTDSNRKVTQISEVKGTTQKQMYRIIVENDGYIYTNQNAATKGEYVLYIKNKAQSGISKDIIDLQINSENLENEIQKNKDAINLLNNNVGYMNVKNENITDGKNVKLEYNNIRKNYSICGYINLTSFSKVRFGKDESKQGYIIEVDNVNVKLTRSRYGSDETLYPHGLTIQTFLGFEIRNVGGYSTVFLYSDNGNYKLEKEIHNPGYDSAFFESEGTTGTLLSFSQVNSDYKKNIWIIQDSYGTWSNWGWTYNIYKIGFDNFLIDSKGGAGSITQLNVLKTHLKYFTPKYIIWAMGMNDADSSTTYNSNWKTALDELIDICNQKNIELILCTIPNVVKSGYLNTYKNRYVRQLAIDDGYQIIDFADAVQLSFESNKWKPGLLSDDELHPNENGGKVLSVRAFTDFPLLLCCNNISNIPNFVN
jgi:hypothetical protein